MISHYAARPIDWSQMPAAVGIARVNLSALAVHIERVDGVIDIYGARLARGKWIADANAPAEISAPRWIRADRNDDLGFSNLKHHLEDVFAGNQFMHSLANAGVRHYAYTVAPQQLDTVRKIMVAVHGDVLRMRLDSMPDLDIEISMEDGAHSVEFVPFDPHNKTMRQVGHCGVNCRHMGKN